MTDRLFGGPVTHPTMTASALLDRLRRHYIKPGADPAGGVFIPECGRNGGGRQSRCDALYVGFTSTSGRRLIGHEIKVSRSDWRHELDKPGKADRWHDDCHAWYVVAPSTDVVPPEEVPDGWGLMVVNPRTKTRLDVKVKARVHEDRVPSWGAVRSIIARLDTLQRNELWGIRQTAREQAREQIESDVRKRLQGQHERELDHLRGLVASLEKSLGVNLTSWRRDSMVTPERLGEALRLLEAQEPLTRRFGTLNGAINTLTHTLEELRGLQVAVTEYEQRDAS